MAGTYRRRGKNSYYLEVTIGTNYKGKPNRYNKTVHCSTDKQAEKELAKFYTECDSGNATKQSTITVYAMCKDVLEKAIKPNKKRNTIRGYETCLRQIKESIGNLKAAKVTPKHVQEWVNEMHKTLSGKTIHNRYSFLHMCYDVSVGWQVVRNNPCSHVNLPKIERKDPPMLLKNELAEFLDILDDIPEEKMDYKVAYMLALFCGLRRGEICGLDDPEDIDTKKCELFVRKTRNIEAGGVYKDSPKSKSSIRATAFPKVLTDEIEKLRLFHKKQKMLWGSEWIDSSALIKSAKGNPMYPGNLLEYLHKICKGHSFENIHNHALRHTHASMMNYLGHDLLEISAQLGHSQKSTTLNIYQHLFEDKNERSHRMADDLDALISGKK